MSISRRFIQFRLRHVAVAMVLLCIVFAVLGRRFQERQIEKQWLDVGVYAGHTRDGKIGLDFTSTIVSRPVTPQLWKSVIDLRRSLVELDIRHCDVSDNDIQGISLLHELRKLEITGNHRVTDVTADAIASLSNLKVLEIGATGITDQGILALKDMSSLRTLDLSNTAITDRGVAHISNVETLEDLQLDGCNITDVGLGHLHKCSNLRSLSVRFCPAITDEGIRELEMAVPNIEIFSER